MHIVCAICRDFLIQPDDISFIRCGHVFHSNCLLRWLDRTNSCPQCREKVSQNKVRKLYITFSNTDAELDNAIHLCMQERIDSLNFQVLLNENNIKYYVAKNETLEKQNSGLRQEVRRVESMVNYHNTTISILKERMKVYKEKYLDYETLKHKLSRREKEIEKLKHIEALLHGSIEEAEKIIKETTNREALIGYILAMKKNMSKKVDEKKQLYKHLVKDLHTLKEIKNLHDALNIKRQLNKSETEKSSTKQSLLQKRIDELEKLLTITSKRSNDMNSSNQRKSNKSSPISHSVYRQVTLKQKIRDQNEPFSQKANTSQDECPIRRKKARYTETKRCSDSSVEIIEVDVTMRHDKNF